MAQYIPFAKDVEVNGETVLATINAFPEFMRDVAKRILEEEGIVNPMPGEWYRQDAWLNSFRIIGEKFGTSTLFEIGKQIPSNAIFPPEINNIEKALRSIDVAYHLNHRNGFIGNYRLVSHDEKKQIMIMQCKNPYPCDFDRGIITAMGRKFQPGIKVTVDPAKPSRKTGADESWYIITY